MIFNGDVLSGVDLTALLVDPSRYRRRRHAAPGAGVGPAGVRLRAHRRDRPGDGVPGEDREPADRPDQRRLLRLPAVGARVDPGGRPVSVERETFPGLLAVRGAGAGLRRQLLLAGPRHARGVRPRVVRPGAGQGPERGAARSGRRRAGAGRRRGGRVRGRRRRVGDRIGRPGGGAGPGSRRRWCSTAR